MNTFDKLHRQNHHGHNLGPPLWEVATPSQT